MIDGATTLGELVTNHPALAAELERRGFDYCCGGDRPLAAACTERGLDVHRTVGELRVAAEATDGDTPVWASMGLVELADHVEATHHRYVRDELPRLSSLLAKITAVHGERHPELAEIGRRFDELRADLEPHLAAEEHVVFPMIRQLARPGAMPVGDLAGRIVEMGRQHDRVGEELAELRELTGGYRPPPDGCASYRACFAGLAALETDTHLHVHKENNLLFPAVARRAQRPAGGQS